MSQPAGRSTAIAGNGSDQGRSVVRRAMAVLGSFSQDRPVQTLSEIQQATGLASAWDFRSPGKR